MIRGFGTFPPVVEIPALEELGLVLLALLLGILALVGLRR